MSTPDDRTLDPASVASATFSTVRRGFEPNEVRAYLHRLSSQLQSVSDREAALRRELDELKASPAQTGQLDEATVAAWLGQEATAVLTAAREAATLQRGKAQDQADQLLHDARVEAERMRSEAVAEATALRDEVAGEVARRRQESMTEAETEIEAARQEGRSMVSEARAVRERMLADLSRRRDGARTQLSALRGERDRIVNAIEATRDHLDRLMDDLRAASPEDERDVPAAGYEQDPRGAAGEPRLTLVRPLHPVHQDLPGDSALDTGETTSILAGELGPDDLTGGLELDDDVLLGAGAGGPTGEAGVEAADGVESPYEPETEVDLSEAITPPPSDVDLAAELAAVEDADAGDEEKPSVDDLFARIRAARTDAVGGVTAEVEVVEGEGGEGAEDAEALDPQAVLVAERNLAIAPYQAALGRQLKRALADEQNEVFDRLRQASRVTGVVDVLGDERDHAERYRAAGEDSVWGAALAGARSTAPAGDAVDGGHEGALERHRVLDEVLDEITREVARPVREHLESALAGADGDPEEATALLRNAYREWKSQRLDELAAELVHSAYGRGAYAGVDPGTLVQWVVDASAPRCPDGEMNAAAGAIACGEAFPSGHQHPPAYAGCRCLLAVPHG